MDLYTVAVIVHVFGAVLGAGAVTVNDWQFMRAIGDRELGVAYQKSARQFSWIIIAGFLLLLVSGGYFMYARPALWRSEKIITKLGIVAVIAVNGWLMNKRLHGELDKLTSADWEKKTAAMKELVTVGLPYGVVSSVSWWAAVLLGAAGRQPWFAWQVAGAYVLALIATYLAGKLIIRKVLAG
jgi:hypothetical protein